VIASRGALPPEWPAFRQALTPRDRDALGAGTIRQSGQTRRGGSSVSRSEGQPGPDPGDDVDVVDRPARVDLEDRTAQP
jgi:hypothetical protein